MAKVRTTIQPAICVANAGQPNAALNGLNNLGDKSAQVITLDIEDTISTVMAYHYRQGSPGTIRIGIQGVQQSSNNFGWVMDNVWLSYIDVAGTSISTSPGLYAYTLSSPISLASGVYTVVVQNQSGTFDASNRLIHGYAMSVFSNGACGQTGSTNNTSSLTGSTLQSYGAMRGAIKTYGFPYTTFGTTTVSSPNEIGNRIKLNVGSAGYYDVSGVVTRNLATSTGTTIKIYDDTLTAIGSISLPNNSSATQRWSQFYFSSNIRLYPDRYYYLVTSGTHQVDYYTLFQASDNSAFTAHEMQYCNRATTSGAFTITDTRVAEMGLIIEDQAGGGLLTHPGMTGGIRG
jgi:hypothetical protein